VGGDERERDVCDARVGGVREVVSGSIRVGPQRDVDVGLVYPVEPVPVMPSLPLLPLRPL
ncbi:hypothetical protein OSH65_25255, partial [Mycobacterium ulcerans]